MGDATAAKFTSVAHVAGGNTMLALFNRFWHEESGQGLTEYALILALVSIGLIAVLVVFRDAIGGIFDRIAQVLQGAPSEGFTPGA